MSYSVKSLLSSAALVGLTCASVTFAACSSTSNTAPNPAADSSVDTPDTGTNQQDSASDAALPDAAGDGSQPIQCQLGANDPACVTCVKQQCCSLWAECLTTECKPYSECSAKCAAGDTACETACTTKFPAGSALNAQLGKCGEAKCAATCK
jgi:hypothetical protein